MHARRSLFEAKVHSTRVKSFAIFFLPQLIKRATQWCIGHENGKRVYYPWMCHFQIETHSSHSKQNEEECSQTGIQGRRAHDFFCAANVDDSERRLASLKNEDFNFISLSQYRHHDSSAWPGQKCRAFELPARSRVRSFFSGKNRWIITLPKEWITKFSWHPFRGCTCSRLG